MNEEGLNVKKARVKERDSVSLKVKFWEDNTFQASCLCK